MPASQLKKNLRKKLLQERESLTAEEIRKHETCIISSLNSYINQKKFEQIFIFSAIKNEPSLIELSKLNNKIILALPKITSKKDITFLPWTRKAPLQVNGFGIAEPTLDLSHAVKTNQKTLVCVPALAIDKFGNRLGFGGGYYDRFLKANPLVWSIGIIFDQFIQTKLPTQSWDISLNALCTESGIKEF